MLKDNFSKKDAQGLMNSFLEPLIPYYSKGGARLHIGETGVTYDENAIEMEGFSRPLWALGPFWAGGGAHDEFLRIYKNGLINGVDPSHPEFWGGFKDYDQLFVEMAAIASTIILNRELLWNPLTDQQKNNLCHWLLSINDYTIPQNNWLFFRVLVNIAMKKCGMPFRQDIIDADLEEIESYYLGNGWYCDGVSNQKDYYISFAIHYYSLLYSVYMKNEDKERCDIYRKRAHDFAQSFIYWFASDGSALPFGRSLTYRFAECSFWSACVFAGIEPFSLEIIKGIIMRHMNWWINQKIFDLNGILTIGYAYPNLIMAERYNAPGSPYWSMKAFLFMALGDDHPFWSASAADLPKMKDTLCIKEAEMLIQRQKGSVTALVPGCCELFGHGHLPEKYSKFAYSTKYGVSMALSQYNLSEAAPDCMLAFVFKDSDYVYVRLEGTNRITKDNMVVSTWQPVPGITVKTELIPTKTGHIRRHEITSRVECFAYDCGFAVPKFTDGYEELTEDGLATVKNHSGHCTVKSVLGGGEPCFINPNPNTNLLSKNAQIPAVKYTLQGGVSTIETEVEVM